MIKEQIEALRRELEQHNYNYYVLSQPTISDLEFDMKLKQLEELERQYPEYADPLVAHAAGGERPQHRVPAGAPPVSHAVARQHVFGG